MKNNLKANKYVSYQKLYFRMRIIFSKQMFNFLGSSHTLERKVIFSKQIHRILRKVIFSNAQIIFTEPIINFLWKRFSKKGRTFLNNYMIYIYIHLIFDCSIFSRNIKRSFLVCSYIQKITYNLIE